MFSCCCFMETGAAACQSFPREICASYYSLLLFCCAASGSVLFAINLSVCVSLTYGYVMLVGAFGWKH